MQESDIEITSIMNIIIPEMISGRAELSCCTGSAWGGCSDRSMGYKLYKTHQPLICLPDTQNTYLVFFVVFFISGFLPHYTHERKGVIITFD